MIKSKSLKTCMYAVALVSVACAILIEEESLHYAFAAIAFFVLGVSSRAEHQSSKEKSALVFSIMFFCFSILALVFAAASMFIN